MSEMNKLLVFAMCDLRCGLPLSNVERILHAVEIKPLPKAPEIVMGLINLKGRIIPVLNLRKFFCLPETGITLNDHIIIAHTTSRPIAILVDNVLGVSEYNEWDILTPEALFPGIECLEGVAKLGDGIIYIYSLDRLLSSQEKSGIERLLSPAVSAPEVEEG
ncbi:MAG: chemotaxis protein CheW [Pseudomonadota bacterium]